jgi:hypothetical protein
MLHTLRFSLQNAVYFIMLLFLFHVLFTFYIQYVLKFKCKTPVPKGYTNTSVVFVINEHRDERVEQNLIEVLKLSVLLLCLKII